jgi:hypothetical protein
VTAAVVVLPLKNPAMFRHVGARLVATFEHHSVDVRERSILRKMAGSALQRARRPNKLVESIRIDGKGPARTLISELEEMPEPTGSWSVKKDWRREWDSNPR